MARKEESNI